MFAFSNFEIEQNPDLGNAKTPKTKTVVGKEVLCDTVVKVRCLTKMKTLH